MARKSSKTLPNILEAELEEKPVENLLEQESLTSGLNQISSSQSQHQMDV